MQPSFVHLHLHSEFSLRDSLLRLPEKPEEGDPAKAKRPNLVSHAVTLGLPALALTDECNLFALVKFYRAAEAVGIKPIIGADLWIAEDGKPTRVTLLCQNRIGYLNLSRLISRTYLEGRRGDSVLMQPSWLQDANDGLIALLGRCSDLGQLLLADKHAMASARAGQWLRQFDDRLYIELTRTGHPDEQPFLDAALQLASSADIPAVASNDVRFLVAEDFEAHEARVCIHSGRVLRDPKRPHEYTAEQYLKSPQQMQALFADLPEALENSVEIAKRCNLELSFGTYYLPAFPVPVEHTLDSFIHEQAHAGLEKRVARYGIADGFTREQVDERLRSELGVIVKMGFPGYFLIVADFINWAKQHGIPVGPGRGSGAGSLVAYALGITDLDPLRYDLLFERFLNPERVSLPDFDVDFCMDGRDRVIEYVADKYGRDRVSQIITYGTMSARAVLRDTGRVLGMPYGQVDRIAKLIPNRPLDLTLEDALGRSKKSREEPERIVAEFKSMYAADDDVRDLVDLALKLEDLTRNAGRHAGGVVIAPSALTDFAPLYSDGTPDGVVTQFDKDDVETVGLVKFDFLGLRTLTIIDWAVKAVNARRAQRGEAPLDITTLPLDDAATFKLLKSGRTTAVFQLESRGMKELVAKLKPDTFEDIIALVALFRPGPLQSGMVDDFIARKHGRAEAAYPHPSLEPVLKPTYGVIVYQEQVMQIAQTLAGYTLGGADMLRRAMGKKNSAEMAKQRAVFVEGAIERGIHGNLATYIFDLMEKFAEYGFNKSHSAAYALVSYQTAWLKAHYPAEFTAAVLSSDMDNTDKVVIFLDEARALGLKVRPPAVDHCDYMFVADDDGTIRYGLGAIKGVGHAACEAIAGERKRGGPFRDLLDFCRRVDSSKVNKRALEALIYSGALDAQARNRASLMAQLPAAMKAAEQSSRDTQAGQHDIFAASVSAPAAITLAGVDEWPLQQRLLGERESLGHYLSGHPTDACKDLLVQLSSCPLGDVEKHYRPPPVGERRGRPQEQPFIVAGLVTTMRKRGDSMAFVTLEDWSGHIEVSFFREAFIEFAPMLTRDAVLIVEGSLSLDEFSGGFQVRARAVHTLSEACERFARQVKIKLNGIDSGFATRLAQTLAGYRGGNTSLRLNYSNRIGSVDLEVGEDWRLRATPDLRESLAQLNGIVSTEWLLSKPASNSNGS